MSPEELADRLRQRLTARSDLLRCKLGVAFDSVNVLTDPNAESDLQAIGALGFPVVSRGKEFVCAQSLDDVSKFLGREVKFDRLSPAELSRGVVGVRPMPPEPALPSTYST